MITNVTMVLSYFPNIDFNTQRWGPKYYVALGAVHYWIYKDL